MHFSTNIFHRCIVVSPKNYDFVKNRYPNRKIDVSPYCEDKWFHVFRKYPHGIFSVKIDDLSVWIPGDFPYFYKKFKGKNESTI